MTHTSYCPNRDYRLTIEEDDHYYRITDNGHTVTACPSCLIELEVQGGELVEVKQ